MDIDKLRRELDAWSKDDIVPGDLAALCAEASAALARLRAVRDFNSHPKAPDPDSAVHRAMELKLEAAEAELAGLRDLFRLDEEQHANHIKELTKAHEARITKYADELARQRTRAEEAEAELARLREPAGDVGEVVAGLKDRVGDRKWMVDLDRDAADLLLRQAGEIERWRGLRDAIAELRGYGPEWPEHGNVPLAIAAGYSLTLTRATSAENRLREAGEVMQDIDAIARTTAGPGFEAIHRYASAFLAKLEAPPAPEPVREDTYPDRVSMEPWPYSGHAPGGSDADQ